MMGLLEGSSAKASATANQHKRIPPNLKARTYSAGSRVTPGSERDGIRVLWAGSKDVYANKEEGIACR